MRGLQDNSVLILLLLFFIFLFFFLYFFTGSSLKAYETKCKKFEKFATSHCSHSFLAVLFYLPITCHASFFFARNQPNVSLLLAQN